MPYFRLLVLIGLVTATGARAQSPDDPRAANPERPTVATHAYAVAPGYVELEQGVRASGHTSLGDVTVWEANLKIGLARWLQLGLAGDVFARTGSGSGVGDLGAVLKVRTSVSSRVALAIAGGVTAPTGDARLGLGAGAVQGSVVGVVSADLAPAWHVDINAGPTGIGPGRPRFLGTASWSHALGRATVAAETFGYTAGAAGPAQQGVLVALAYRLESTAVADVGGSVGGGAGGVRQAFAGVTVNLGRMFK